jgi:hypothetical protein
MTSGRLQVDDRGTELCVRLLPAKSGWVTALFTCVFAIFLSWPVMVAVALLPYVRWPLVLLVGAGGLLPALSIYLYVLNANLFETRVILFSKAAIRVPRSFLGFKWSRTIDVTDRTCVQAKPSGPFGHLVPDYTWGRSGHWFVSVNNGRRRVALVRGFTGEDARAVAAAVRKTGIEVVLPPGCPS